MKLVKLSFQVINLWLTKQQLKLSRVAGKHWIYAAVFLGLVVVLYQVGDRPIKANKKNPDIVAESVDNSCPKHLPYGLPMGTDKTNDLVVRDEYCLSSNDDTKFADWVAFQLTPETIIGSSDQSRNWKADPAITPAETLEPEDYRGAYSAEGYDRGHLAPLASFRGANWETVNYLSNVVPQKSEFNRGAWKELEDYERDLVREYGEVFVIVGTAYDEGDRQRLPNADEYHNIPDYLWRIMSYDGKIKAYIFPQNTLSGTDFRLGQTTVTEIEQWSGLRFSLNGEFVYEEPSQIPVELEGDRPED